MKTKLFLFLIIACIIPSFGQVKDSYLTNGLLLQVLSGANAIPGTALTSGSLVSGTTYTIGNYVSGDDFTNVGGTNASGTTFKATGTTPTTWTNGSLLTAIDQSALALPNPSYTLSNSGAIPTYGHKSNDSYWSFDGDNDALIYSNSSLFDFGTSNFSIRCRFRLNSVTGYQGIYAQSEGGSDEFALYASASNLRFVIGNGTTYQDVIIKSDLAIGTWYDIVISVDRSGNTVAYNNGAQFYSAAVGLDGAISIDLGGIKLGHFWAGYAFVDIADFMVWNYAFNATGLAYYSDPANHLKAVDQGADGIDLVSGWDFTDGWSATATPVDANTFSTTGQQFIRKNFGMVAGRNYRIVSTGTTSGTPCAIYNFDITTRYGNALALDDIITAVDAGICFITDDTGTIDISSLTVVEAGSTLSLTPEGMLSQSIWRDYYHSTDIAVGTGSTAPRLVKDWAGMGSCYRFNGTTSVLSKTSAPDGLTGDITITGWIFPTGWGEANAGVIFSNGKTIIGLYYNTDALLVTRDASTNAYSANSAISLNAWKHFVITTTSSGTTNVYINGVLSGTSNQSAGTPVSGTSYYVGNLSNGAQTFHGVIDDFKIYKRILSAEEISLSYSVYE